jgi:hypothetical protein
MIMLLPCSGQGKGPYCNNRIGLGLGGENSIMGFDYSRNVYRSKAFIGIGFGQSGWTGYLRLEPLQKYVLVPFASCGFSYTRGETVSFTAQSQVLSLNAGIHAIPGWDRYCLPMISAGASYYKVMKGDAEGGLNTFYLLLKLSFAFPHKIN